MTAEVGLVNLKALALRDTANEHLGAYGLLHDGSPTFLASSLFTGRFILCLPGILLMSIEGRAVRRACKKRERTLLV